MENDKKLCDQQVSKQIRLWGRPIKLMEKKEVEKKIKEGTGLPFGRITASMVKDYLKCPKLFYYRYVMNLRLPMKGIQLVFGGALHKAVEVFYSTSDPLITHKSFDQEFLREKIEPFDEEEFIENLNEGHRMIQEFIDQFTYLHDYYGINKQGQSEISFRTWWKDPIVGQLLPLQSTGRYDRITDTHQIIEFKTSSKAYRQDEVDLTEQASFYSMSYFMEHQIIPPEIFYIVFIKGRKNPIQVLKTSRNRDQHSQIFQTVNLVLKNVKGNQFEKGTGFMHKYCDCQKYESMLLLK